MGDAGEDVSVRSAIGQAFKRQLVQNEAAQAMYDMLPDSDRVKFRQAWSVQRSFQFIKESRVKRQPIPRTLAKRLVS